MNERNAMAAILVAAIMGSIPYAGAATSETAEPQDGQCNNYGNQVQFSATGDNSYRCNAQYCVNGGGTAGSAGLALGTTPGSDADAGAQASAGTGCTQNNTEARSGSAREGGW